MRQKKTARHVTQTQLEILMDVIFEKFGTLERIVTLMAIRPGREVGPVCNASDPFDDKACTCTLPALHIGNIHSCAGDDKHSPHVWTFQGREVPAKEPIDTEVQCPNCNLTFHTRDARNIDTQKQTLPGNLVKA